MLEATPGDKSACLDQRLDHGLVRIALFAFVGKDPLALEARRFQGKSAIFVDGVGDPGVDAPLGERPAASGPQLEVLAPVARGGMDETGSRLVGHMVAGE